MITSASRILFKKVNVRNCRSTNAVRNRVSDGDKIVLVSIAEIIALAGTELEIKKIKENMRRSTNRNIKYALVAIDLEIAARSELEAKMCDKSSKLFLSITASTLLS